jgi:hypothetical protein
VHRVRLILMMGCRSRSHLLTRRVSWLAKPDGRTKRLHAEERKWTNGCKEPRSPAASRGARVVVTRLRGLGCIPLSNVTLPSDYSRELRIWRREIDRIG